jgi:2-amino-4-hydroxy-6-hydroxymethyldihydropteridine diphosphokinase
MISNVYIALGANIGNRAANLETVIEYIDKLPDTRVSAQSKIYETDPVGYLDQGQFLNMVIEIHTAFEPLALLKELQNIEKELKRTREIHWGPRTIDIDILLYGDREINYPDLIIPHPRMFDRAFVLVPLRDVYPDKKINGKDIDELIDKCADNNGIKPYLFT